MRLFTLSTIILFIISVGCNAQSKYYEITKELIPYSEFDVPNDKYTLVRRLKDRTFFHNGYLMKFRGSSNTSEQDQDFTNNNVYIIDSKSNLVFQKINNYNNNPPFQILKHPQYSVYVWDSKPTEKTKTINYCYFGQCRKQVTF